MALLEKARVAWEATSEGLLRRYRTICYATSYGCSHRTPVSHYYFTVCVNTDEVLALKFVAPLYVAVIACEPVESAEVLNVATPDPVGVPLPRVELPSLNVTVPVGVPAPAPLALTVAVKVTDLPGLEGLAEEVTIVVVGDWWTVCVSTADVLAAKLVFPPRGQDSLGRSKLFRRNPSSLFDESNRPRPRLVRSHRFR